MKMKIEFEGDVIEEMHDMKTIMYARDLYVIVTSVDEAIRSRLKYNDNIGEDEIRFLEGLREELNINFLD